MRLSCAVVFVLSVLTSPVSAKTVNILLIGSTRRFASDATVAPLDWKANGNQVSAILKRELKIAGQANITFEDIYRSKAVDTAMGQNGTESSMTYHAHSLAQWFFWPEGRDERLANLRGQGKTAWDYVVLAGDPYLIAHMPGVYAEGVTLIADEVAKSNAKLVLIASWSGGTAASQMEHVVSRVATSGGFQVVPGNIATQAARAAKAAPKGDHPFAMNPLDKPLITYHHTGSSSEKGIEQSLRAAASRGGATVKKVAPAEGQPKVDFNYGRGNSAFEKDKQYKVAPDLYSRAYGFPMQDHSKTATTSMLYGIDRRPDDGTDLGIAHDMIRQDELKQGVRAVPIRLLWAKLNDAAPGGSPMGDRWHMHRDLLDATGTYLFTTVSGRTPLGDKPSDGDAKAMRSWTAHRIGYETAWRMSHLQTRVPGFVVRPRDGTRHVSADEPDSLEVKFHYPPTHPVAVTIATSEPGAAQVTPTQLIFTPQNHATAQTVAICGPALSQSTPVKITFTTVSEDPVFDGLATSWFHTVEESQAPDPAIHTPLAVR
jgi:hypothetical protein